MEVETDKVLSAIRRGEDSLPKLRAATGLEYTQLHSVLYDLQFNDRSVREIETADGYARYMLERDEKSKARDETLLPTVPPAAFNTTPASLEARDLTLLQRDAPYCVQCRGLCFVNGVSEDRVRWRCRACNEIFDGSLMGRIDPLTDPEPKPRVSVMRPREELGPEEEAAIEAMRVRTDHPTIGDDEEAALAAMRGGELSEEEARIAEEIDRELAEVVEEEEVEAKEICGCGRELPHGGRCSARRNGSSKNTGGRPRIEVDLQKFEDLLANPRLSLSEVCEGTGIKRNLIYDRKDVDPEFGAAYRRGMDRREAAIADGALTRSGENITEMITGDSLSEEAEKPTDPKTVEGNGLQAKVSKPAHNMRENIPPNESLATVDDPGFIVYDSVDDCVSEVVNWPKERVVEFFDALARAMGLPQRPARTEIKLAWSRDFEDTSPDGTVGLTYLYLISMLHHNMEPHEKEAVWTLVQYLKRMEAYVEEKAQHERLNTT